MSHHIVEVKDLHYRYADGTTALNSVSFRITHGESVAVVGANGAGKSTLLMHLNGYLTPQKGQIRIGDMPLTRQTIAHIRRTVGMVFQDPDDQLFMPTVEEDVAFGPLNLGLPLEEVNARVEQALIQVGALHLKKRLSHHISGGEKRRVAIASVLTMEPDILVLDEPGTGLDPRGRKILIELLASFKHTKILATHDLDMAMDLCERTIVLHNGQIVADGLTLNIFNNDELLQKSHLERPLRLQGCPVCNPKIHL
ncbi:MAG: ABC transporter ATP-binding protein [Dissulfuribacterales bacterium]